jgi:hypothetical protein
MMNNLTAFLTRLQTFNPRLVKQEAPIKADSKEMKSIDVYDITRETPYYDSFSYKSELRVLKDMALIDLLALDKKRIGLQLAQLNKIKDRFKELWENYHQHYHDYHKDYKASYPFSIKLDTLFIVHNLQGDNADVVVTAQFVEDLADSIKLRESFLKELIRDVETMMEKQDPVANESLNSDEEISQPEDKSLKQEAPMQVNRYPTFKEGAANQLYSILKPYFIAEDHFKLENLLLNNQTPESPLVFRDNGNKLADAFKQLYDARLIVGCQLIDLEKWIAPKFLYLRNDGEQREFSDGYLNGMISTKSRPCKSPILKIEQQNNDFFILPVSRNKK